MKAYSFTKKRVIDIYICDVYLLYIFEAVKMIQFSTLEYSRNFFDLFRKWTILIYYN